MNLTRNFTLAELDPKGAAPAGVLGNLQASADVLQSIRDAVGVPMRVTSGYRTSSYNASVGGSPTSAHLTGRAVDFVPVGISLWEFHKRLKAAEEAGQVAPYVEMIFYPFDKGHIHIQTLGGSYPRDKRVKVGFEYLPLSLEWLAKFPGAAGFATGGLLLLLLVLGVLVIQALQRG